MSSYNPLDLFHGGKEGIMQSLANLERTPQNNLRLFIDGKMQFPDKAKTPLSKALGGSATLKEELFSAICEALLTEDVLKRILEAQTLGPLNDIESVFPVYQEILNAGVDIGDFHQGYRRDYFPAVPPETMEDRIEIVKRFLISCTARDCSVMLTFSNCTSPCRPTLGRCCKGKWCYEITVVDLDAKPLSKMPYYYNVDEDIARNYTIRVERNEPSPRNGAKDS